MKLIQKICHIGEDIVKVNNLMKVVTQILPLGTESLRISTFSAYEMITIFGAASTSKCPFTAWLTAFHETMCPTLVLLLAYFSFQRLLKATFNHFIANRSKEAHLFVETSQLNHSRLMSGKDSTMEYMPSTTKGWSNVTIACAWYCFACKDINLNVD